MKRILFISGTWDDEGGKPSSFALKLMKSMMKQFDHLAMGHVLVDEMNGGYFNGLESYFKDKTNIDADIVVWMPNVPNDKPKLLNKIKQNNPHVLLVSSKRNDECKYSFSHLIGRALTSKSNMFLEFKNKGGVIHSSVYDPLGNCYIKESSDVNEVGKALANRLSQIHDLTRIKSTYAGDFVPDLLYITDPISTERDLFFEYVRKHSDTFHKIIQGDNNDRFVGNLSFRCKHGFPSFKKNNIIFVSKRNVDKRYIDMGSFVPVELDAVVNEIRYYGENKPSVDTPIQVELYRTFPQINWMMHSHVYIKDAPFTNHIVPCGAIEEVLDIVFCAISNKIEKSDNIFINLKGHGSIAMSSSVNAFDESLTNRYIGRPMPEMQIEGE